MDMGSRFVAFAVILAPALLVAQQPSFPAPTTAADAPVRDTSYIDAQGTAHVTRVVAIPPTVSEEARQFLARQIPDEAPPESLAERRARTDDTAKRRADAWSKLCPGVITEEKIAGVPVRIVTPDGMPEANRGKVLMNLHGGGFDSDSGSYPESIPIASYAKMKVVSVLYRLAPENVYPAAVEDAIVVYKELLKSHAPHQIAIYGTSAGAVITGEVAVRIKDLGLPEPGALGIFSGFGDFARKGDSLSIFGIPGLSGHLDPPKEVPRANEYLRGADPLNPLVSPIYADLHGMPPTLFVSSERDLLLSGTTNLHRAFLKAGVDAQLVVFDALPHAFWYEPGLPESIDASHFMADFFIRQLGKY
jgi:acetyl esterase/lipase